MTQFLEHSKRYELREGTTPDAPSCPYGNHYKWIGFDLRKQEYVRFVKSVFKLLVRAKPGH